MRSGFIIIGICFNTLLFSQVNFTIQHQQITTDPIEIHSADINNDSIIDIAVINQSSSFFTSYLGVGDGTFTFHQSIATYLAPASFTFGYFNTDNHIDVVIGHDAEENLLVFVNDGNGNYSDSTGYERISVNGISKIITANIDNDAYQDICYMSDFDAPSLYFRLGVDSFSTGRILYNLPGLLPAIEFADFNNDQINDIALVLNDSAGNSTLRITDGIDSMNNIFFSVFNNYAAGIAAHYLCVADIDGDGNNDVLTANDNYITIRYGLTDKPDSALTYIITQFANDKIATADFNNDSIIDIATVNKVDSSITIISGNGNRTFATPAYFFADASPNSFTIGDFNNDGKKDIAVANENAGKISILINETSSGFGKEASEINSFSLFPNPTTGQINISQKHQNTNEAIYASVYDITGKIVLEKTFIATAPLIIDINQLEGGMYYLQLRTEHGVVNKKIVKD